MSKQGISKPKIREGPMVYLALFSLNRVTNRVTVWGLMLTACLSRSFLSG
jgi:hypothetical protein